MFISTRDSTKKVHSAVVKRKLHLLISCKWLKYLFASLLLGLYYDKKINTPCYGDWNELNDDTEMLMRCCWDAAEMLLRCRWDAAEMPLRSHWDAGKVPVRWHWNHIKMRPRFILKLFLQVQKCLVCMFNWIFMK